jgi:3-deoxy-manno-octulosonate cytidylyltransferase (CMP-KDO synthetase)
MQRRHRSLIISLGLNQTMPKIAIVVPARMPSARFPGKPLYLIKKKPLILWTAERIAREAPQIPLFFAIEDAEVAALLRENGFQPIMTRPDHPSGTDRIAEANETIGADTIINVQADEPLISGRQIDTLAALIEEGVDMATLATRFRKEEDFRDINKVKVVLDNRGRALYFSRSHIPFARERKGFVDADWLEHNHCFWHMGIYAYQAKFLRTYAELPRGNLEMIERLEQLRALENGYSVAVGLSDEPTLGVDTPEDAAAIEPLLE